MSFTKSAKAACLISILISFYTIVSYAYRPGSWAAIVPLTGVFLLAVAMVAAVRATVVAWITVLVLMAFAGNRRKVLVAQGHNITIEVVMYLVKVVFKERGFVTFACATVLSLMAVCYPRS